MKYFVKIFIHLLLLRYNVESKAINKGLLRKSVQFELVPFKHFSFLIENLTPFGKFEMKHSLEKRDTVEEPPIANEIPVIEEKKETVVLTSVVPAVEPPVPVPLPAPKADVIPFVIELAPKPVEAPPDAPVVVKEPPPVQTPNIPVFYTDISQIPLYNFAYSKPVSLEVPKPIPVVPEVVPPVVAVPEVPPQPVPVVPVEPVSVAAVPVPEPVAEVPVPIPEDPVKPVSVVQEVVVKPEPVEPKVPPPETPVVVPKLPNYLVKGSRLILFFGSKMLQMLSQFIDGRSFSEFTLPPLPQLPPLGKKK